MKGFFVPNSVSGSYVANKRNSDNSLMYDSQYNQIGLNKQSAIQQLNKNYDTTINNAYSSYLSSRNNIMTSNMGQGYKDAYLALQKASLNQNIIDTNTSLESARYEINQSAEEMQNQVYENYETEVSYFDRLANSLNDYLSYVKGLSKEATENEIMAADAYNYLQTATEDDKALAIARFAKVAELTGYNMSEFEDISARLNGNMLNYLTSDQMNMDAKDLYEVLLNLQAPDYTDAEGNNALPFIQWLNNQLKDTDDDNTWSKWLFGQGGYQEFVNSTKKR